MTPRQRVEIALRGGHSDRVPFTMYENKIPQCTAERMMRNRGLCIVNRHSVFSTHYENVKTHQQYEGDSIRATYETPVGTVSTLYEPAGFTTWVHEKLFKTPDDYKVLLYLIQSERYEPIYDTFLEAQDRFGEDGIFRADFGLEPLQTLISGSMMGMEDFCMEWMDNRDEILKLFDALVENRRKMYPLVAKSPALFANYGGNVTSEIIGLETFEKYYVPHYNEAAAVMHEHGKLVGCHFDANCKLLSKAIATTDLDYIEAFTPAPDTDMTLREAREAWPDKVLWLNFPSSQHLQPDEEVERVALDLLDQAGHPDGLLMGITEDVPLHRWQMSCQAIMNGLERHAQDKPLWYSTPRVT